MSPLGWSLNAISGMLGNMNYESTINAGVIEGFITSTPPDKGYGLIQWTDSHATNVHDNPLWKWVHKNYGDYEWDIPERQCVFINGDDETYWYAVSAYPLSYADFKVSVEEPAYLARAYFYNRERGTWFPQRATAAQYWYEFLSGIEPEPPEPPDPPEPPTPEKKKGMPLYMYPRVRYGKL